MSYPENPLRGLPPYPVNPEAECTRFVGGPYAPAVREPFPLKDYQRQAFGQFNPNVGIRDFMNGLKENVATRYYIVNKKEDEVRYVKGYTRPLKFRTDFPAGMQNTFHYDNSTAEWEVELTHDIAEAKIFEIHPGSQAQMLLLQHRLTMKNWGDDRGWVATPVSEATPEGKEEPPFYIMGTFYKRFIRKSPHLRYGQQFHQWAKLEKLTSPKAKDYADKIYNAPDAEARKLIEAIVDWNN